MFSVWEGDEKLGYFPYFNASFRDWCTDSTKATTTLKKSILMKLIGAINKSSYNQLFFKFLGYLVPIITQKKHSNRNISEYIWFTLFDHKFGN